MPKSFHQLQSAFFNVVKYCLNVQGYDFTLLIFVKPLIFFTLFTLIKLVGVTLVNYVGFKYTII